MKKLLSVLLIFGLMLCLTACGEEKKIKNENTVDLEYYAHLGQIPECEYALGDDVEKAKSELNAAADADPEKTYYLQEGKRNVLIDSGTQNYYYIKEKAADGISYIVSYETAYGFEIGAIDIEIKDAIADTEYKEEKLSEDNAFFLVGASEGSVIRCEFEKNTILFVFQDNALCATAIYKNDDWK